MSTASDSEDVNVVVLAAAEDSPNELPKPSTITSTTLDAENSPYVNSVPGTSAAAVAAAAAYANSLPFQHSNGLSSTGLAASLAACQSVQSVQQSNASISNGSNLAAVAASAAAAQHQAAVAAAAISASERNQSNSSSGSGPRNTPPAFNHPAPFTMNMNHPSFTSAAAAYPWGSSIGRPGGLPTGPVGFAASLAARRFQCKLCPAMFDSKAELQVHTQVHMREAKPYKCTHCPKSFANSSYLSQHMRIHLGIKPFGPCQYCGRKFTQLSHLQQHLRTHTGEKPYKCRYPGCEKAFSQLSNLQSHSRCHQTDKPFKCNSCYKCFNEEQSLLEHIPKHNETKHVKKCICPFCGKSYSQHSYLAKHMTKHSDKKNVFNFGKTASFDSDNGLLSPQGICAIHGVVDGCGDISPNGASFLSSPFASGHPGIHTQSPVGPGYVSVSQAASAMANFAPSAMDPSNFRNMFHRMPAFPTMQAANNVNRNPYSFYDGRTAAMSGYDTGSSTLQHNLIGLDEIRRYTDAFAGSGLFQRKQEAAARGDNAY